jgi:hypothetical protein
MKIITTLCCVLIICLLFYFLGRQLLIKAVNRVWTELIHSKKQVLEELFKVTLPMNDRGHVDIAMARPLIEEASLKCWQNHLGKEAYRAHDYGVHCKMKAFP